MSISRNHWKYMKLDLDPTTLPPKAALIEELRNNGGTDAALAEIRERQYDIYGCELIWLYPISQGDSAGAYILPVREGILWIPYDEMEKENGAILLLDDADLLDEDTCDIFADDFFCYANELRNVLKQAAQICHGLERGCVPPRKEKSRNENA